MNLQNKSLSMESFAGIFHGDTELRYELNERLAIMLHMSLIDDFESVDGHTLESGVSDLTDDCFYELYDSDLPTIGIDARRSFMGSELVGLAAHEEATRANIIYVHPSTDGVSINIDPSTDVAHLQARSGVLMSPKGEMYLGDFPETVVIDRFETADSDLLQQCRDTGIPTFLDVDTMNRYDDKSQVETLATPSVVATPRQLARSAFLALDTTDDLVIKPRIGSQGRGVVLTDFRSDSDHTKRYYEFLERCLYEPVVEERIRSFEILDPDTNKRLDWNVRAILTYGELAGMYVRADTWGGPVNMSKTAQAIMLKDFHKYFANTIDANDVIRELHRAARAVAIENPASFVAADLTVDEDGNAYLFELNHGHAGGVQTIARMQDSYDDVMRIPRHILGSFIANTKKANIDYRSKGIDIPLESSFTSHVLSIIQSSQSDAVKHLSPMDIPRSRQESVGAALSLIAIRQNGFHHLKRNEKDALETRLSMEHPIEIAHFMKLLGTWDQRAKLLPYIDAHDGLVTENPDTVKTRVIHSARNFDRQQYLHYFQQLNRDFGTVNSMSFHESVAANFTGNFSGFIEDEEALQRINAAMSIILYGQERGNSDIADNMIDVYINEEQDEQLLRAFHGLKFWTLFGDKKYKEALEYVDTLEAVFSDRQELYHNVIYTTMPLSLDDFRRYNFEKTEFITRLVMRADDPLSGLVDLVISPWQTNITEQEVAKITNIVSQSMPLDGKRRERKELNNVLYSLKTAGHQYRRPWKHDRDISRLSDFRATTRLIEAIANYNQPLIVRYIDELRQRKVFEASLDIIEHMFLQK